MSTILKWLKWSLKPYVLLMLTVLLGLGIGATSLLALHGDGNAALDTTWNHIQTYKTLVVGIDPNFQPFGIYNETGPTGIDADLAQAIGDELGVEVRFVLVSYDSMFDSLYLGEVDVVISALRPDYAQIDRFRYTRPYFDAGYVFVGLEDAVLPPHLQDLEGQILAVEYATEGDVAAFELLEAEDTHFELKRLLSVDEALQAVVDGQADYALVDSVSAYLFQQEHPQVQIAAKAEIPDPYVIAVRRPNWQLFLALEDALKSLQEQGTLEAIAAKWLS